MGHPTGATRWHWRAAIVAAVSTLAFAGLPQAVWAQSAPQTIVASSLNPSQYGRSVTFTALIAGNGNGAPSGSVQFMDGPTALGGAVAVNTLGAGYPIAGGSQHTCAVTVAGGVKCWGFNYYGELGNSANNGTFNANPTPLDTGLSGVVAVAAAAYHSCAVTMAGGVECWGYNNKGQLGSDPGVVGTSSSTPLDTGLTGVAAIAAGEYHTCAVTAGGGVKCWGDNGLGQLGSDTGGGTSPTPLDTGLTDVVALTAGTYHTCALTGVGGVMCWGYGGNGQVGDLSNLTGVVAIAAGANHSCALTSSGGVKCWGYNANGQLGNNSTTSSNTPVDVSGLTSGVAAIAAGGDHTCALTAAGGVKCWGYNLSGELGSDPNIVGTSSGTPLDTGLSGIVAIAAGLYQSCALTAAGAAKCWGLNNYGELGSDPGVVGQSSSTPLDVTDFGDGAAQLFGSARLPTAALAVGSHSVTAVYSGDTNHTTSTSLALTQTVGQAQTTTTLVSSANPSLSGQPVTFTATMPSDATGTVTFAVDGTNQPPATVSAGTATLTTSALSPGLHTIAAHYDGDSNYLGSDATPLSQEVDQAPAITSSASATFTIGSAGSFTVTATGYPVPSVTLEGTLPNGLSFAPGTGTAVISGTPTTGAGGPHTLTIKADNGIGLATEDFEITIDRTYGLVTLSPSPNPSTAGQAVTLTANVYGQATPTGVVIFSDGAISLGIGSISGGVAVLSTSVLAVGSHSLSAFYIGNDDLNPTSSSTQTLTVNKAATTTTVASNVANPVSGQPVTLTATIAVTAPGSATVTGSVNFKDGATTLGTATVSGGQAQITTSALAAGNRTVTATYTPDDAAPLTGSSGTKSVTVSKAATTLTVSASPNPAKPGAGVTLKATVAVTAPATGTPSGSVIFKDGAKTLGSGTIASGKATVTVSSLTIGSHSITASYAGSTTLSASTGSASVTIDPKIGPEFRVNTTVAGSQQLPAVARLASNAFVIVWASNVQDGAGYGVYGQRYNANGVKLGAEFRVNTATAKDQTQPSIAGLKDGGFVVAWQSNGEDGSGLGIYAQRYTAAGAKSGSEFKVNTTTASQQSLPAVTALAAGGFVVAWTSNAQDGSGLGIYAQRYDATAKAAGTEFKVNKTTAGDQSNPSLAGLTGGGFVIAWQSSGQDGSGLGVYAQRYDANGKALGTESRVNTVAVNDQSLPSIAALDTGGFVIAWQSALQDGSGLGVYMQRFTVTGIKAGGETLVNTWTASDQATPSVATFSDGGFVVTWASKGQDGSGQGIYAQLFKDTGVKVNVEFAVNTTTTANQYQPAAAAFASGSFVAVWTSVGQDGSLEGVYAQRFLVPGTH